LQLISINTVSPHPTILGVIHVYRRIRDLREDADLTQSQMAKILNCSQQVYANYELGQRDIPTAILIALATYHNTTTDYILGLINHRDRLYK